MNIMLLIGGVFQLLLGALHIFLSRQIQITPGIRPADRALMQALNIGGMLMIFFVAYVSFFCRRELMSTHVGRAVLVLVCLFYFARAIESPLLFGFEPTIFVVCIVVGLLYLVPLIGSLRQRRAAGARAAVSA